MSNPYSRRIMLLSLVNTKEQIRRSRRNIIIILIIIIIIIFIIIIITFSVITI